MLASGKLITIRSGSKGEAEASGSLFLTCHVFEELVISLATTRLQKSLASMSSKSTPLGSNASAAAIVSTRGAPPCKRPSC